ncbi:hypothetical protein [Nitrosomonas supralitoralis]|uniref:Uncharacterized protein n=1 Tax=Nitrosomonas supralitoralis TaxID=2116706 RepID=A0A2P7NYJ0_9PROT|nr:hypothetical protein [Nitrosomonas supralitoralis]PSJ18520.1 hypothetical protein C7H79_02755 [Nitrosomonas supralitoralis]
MMFPLTNTILWLYASFVNAKSLARFGSLLRKRIPPLSGFFVSGIYFICPLFFYGWIFWGAFGLAGTFVQSSNLTYSPAPCRARVAVSRTVNKGA